MPEPACDRAREAISLGDAESAASHLDVCEDCRREAAETDRLLDALAQSAVLDPPPDVDARVRESIRALPARPFRPWSAGFAAGLGIGSIAAVALALGAALAETPLGTSGPWVSFFAVIGYLGVSFVVTLPLLLGRLPRRRERVQEVRT